MLTSEALGDEAQAKRDFSRASEFAPKEGYAKDIKSKLAENGFPSNQRRNEHPENKVQNSPEK